MFSLKNALLFSAAMIGSCAAIKAYLWHRLRKIDGLGDVHEASSKTKNLWHE